MQGSRFKVIRQSVEGSRERAEQKERIEKMQREKSRRRKKLEAVAIFRFDIRHLGQGCLILSLATSLSTRL